MYMEDLEDSFESDPSIIESVYNFIDYPPSTNINKTLEEKSMIFSKIQKESQHTIPSESFKSEEL